MFLSRNTASGLVVGMGDQSEEDDVREMESQASVRRGIRTCCCKCCIVAQKHLDRGRQGHRIKDVLYPRRAAVKDTYA